MERQIGDEHPVYEWCLYEMCYIVSIYMKYDHYSVVYDDYTTCI